VQARAGPSPTRVSDSFLRTCAVRVCGRRSLSGRAQRRKQIASLLSKANPGLGRERAQDRAAVILFLLKGERAFAQGKPSAKRRWIRELHRLVRQYVVEALKER
jgi:hypothetical protein